MRLLRVLVAEAMIAFGTLFVGSVLESGRAQRIAYAVGIVGGLVVLLALQLRERRRPKPEFERVERIVKRDGRTEVHWEEHKYGTTVVVEGQARSTIAVSGKATGVVLKTFPVECTFNEGMWWLILDKYDEEVAYFRVVVTDPLGGGGRKEFAQAGQRIIVRYPEDFKIGIPSDEAKHPWGRHWVTWEVFRTTKDKQDLRLEGKASCEFDWKPDPAGGEVGDQPEDWIFSKLDRSTEAIAMHRQKGDQVELALRQLDKVANLSLPGLVVCEVTHPNGLASSESRNLGSERSLTSITSPFGSWNPPDITFDYPFKELDHPLADGPYQVDWFATSTLHGARKPLGSDRFTIRDGEMVE